MREHLQMVWIAANPVVTFVVNLFLGWNHSEKVDPHTDVGGYRSTVETHPSIMTTPASAGRTALPFPAAGVVIDDDFGHDLVKDLLPSPCKGWDECLNRHW